jgi:hypothetical protein
VVVGVGVQGGWGKVRCKAQDARRRQLLHSWANTRPATLCAPSNVPRGVPP